MNVTQCNTCEHLHESYWCARHIPFTDKVFEFKDGITVLITSTGYEIPIRDICLCDKVTS